MKTKIISIALIAMVILSGYQFLLLLDAGISLDAAREHGKAMAVRGNLALELLKRKWIGAQAKEIIDCDNCFPPGTILKSEAESVEVGEIVFVVKNEIVVDVKYMY